MSIVRLRAQDFAAWHSINRRSSAASLLSLDPIVPGWRGRRRCPVKDHFEIDSAEVVSSIGPRRVADVWRLINRKPEPVDDIGGINIGTIGAGRNDNRNSYLVSLNDRRTDERQREHDDNGGHQPARTVGVAWTSHIRSVISHHHFILVR